MCILVFDLSFFKKFLDPTVITGSFAEACINSRKSNHIDNHYIFTIAFHGFLYFNRIAFSIGRTHHMRLVAYIELRNYD